MLLHGLSFLAVMAIGLLVSNYMAVVYRMQLFAARNFGSVPDNGTEFDFVVVGSGSAGSVVTRRLAEGGYR